MEKDKIILWNDSKVQEFLKYLGVDFSLVTKVVITVNMDDAVLIEETRIAKSD